MGHAGINPAIAGGSPLRVGLIGWSNNIHEFQQLASQHADSCLDLGAPEGIDFDELLNQPVDTVAVNGEALGEALMDFVRKLEQHGVASRFPVAIYMPGAEKTHLVGEIISHGINYVLNLEMPVDALYAMLRTSYASSALVRKLQQEVAMRTSAIGYIRSGEFEIQTFFEARNLSTMLSLACPDPRSAALGLFEILINSIEHGILRIGYDRKTELLASGDYLAHVEKMIKAHPRPDDIVVVRFNRMEDRLVFHVIDPGPGFNPKPYMEFSPERTLDTHGRGIAMARFTSFDTLEYIGNGNEVRCEIFLP